MKLIELEYTCISSNILTDTLFILLQAFFEGKLKITGNTALAMKLQSIVPTPGKAKI